MSRHPGPLLLVLVAACAGLGCYDLTRSPFQSRPDAGADGGTGGGTPGGEPTVVWATKIGSADEHTTYVAALKTGDLLAAGAFKDSATFGQGQPGEMTLTSDADPSGGYVARYRPDGSLGYARQLRTADIVAPHHVGALDGDRFAVAGSFEHSLTLDTAAGPLSLSSDLGSVDAFFAIFDGQGRAEWAVATTGTSTESGVAVANQPGSGGRVVVAGKYDGPAAFQGIALAHQGGSTNRSFLASCDTQGAVTWLRQTDGAAAIDHIVVAGDHVLAAGRFTGETSFGASGDGGVLSLAAKGTADLFVAAYALSDGSVAWAMSAGETGGEVTRAVLGVHPALPETLVVAGTFQSKVSFGTESAHQLATLPEHSDLFLAYYELDPYHESPPTLDRVGKGGGEISKGCATAALRSDGSVLVAGTFDEPTATFGEGPTQVELTSAGYQDGYVGLYDAQGTIAWARRFGGATFRDYPSSLVIPAGDSIVMSGTFDDEMTFGAPDASVEPLLGGADSADGFLLRLSLGGGP